MIKRKAFTLIELIITITCLIITSTLVLQVYQNTTNHIESKHNLSELKQMQGYIEYARSLSSIYKAGVTLQLTENRTENRQDKLTIELKLLEAQGQPIEINRFNFTNAEFSFKHFGQRYQKNRIVFKQNNTLGNGTIYILDKTQTPHKNLKIVINDVGRSYTVI